MKAVVYYGQNIIKTESITTPVPKKGEILVKIKACAICGTDLRIISNGHPAIKPPAIIGHEIAGEVYQLGKDIKGYNQGDRVVIVTPVGCGKCRYCQEDRQNMCVLVAKQTHSLGYYCSGGFSEYMLIPKEAVLNNNLIKVSTKLSFEELSLIEPFSCVINGQEYLSIKPNDQVAIFGAGPIGCMHALLAKTKGVKKIIMIDVNADRLKLAKKAKAADVYIVNQKIDLAKKVFNLTDNEGAEVVIVACSSHEAQKQSLLISGIRSRISFFGGLPKTNPEILFNSNNLHYQEKSLFGAFASSHRHYKKAIKLLSEKKINLKQLITHKLKLEEFESGLKIMKNGEGLKVVIIP